MGTSGSLWGSGTSGMECWMQTGNQEEAGGLQVITGIKASSFRCSDGAVHGP